MPSCAPAPSARERATRARSSSPSTCRPRGSASGRGLPTPAGPVPIVVAAGLFDLPIGDASVRPGPDEGRASCEDAREDGYATGAVGAGTGATVGQWRGEERPSGLAVAREQEGELLVAALVVVNAFGDLRERGPTATGG